jgi:FixJ family two-component response regulator
MNESVSQICVVDDDLSVRESVGRLVKSAGLNVKTFATAEETLANLGTMATKGWHAICLTMLLNQSNRKDIL